MHCKCSEEKEKFLCFDYIGFGEERKAILRLPTWKLRMRIESSDSGLFWVCFCFVLGPVLCRLLGPLKWGTFTLSDSF